MRDSTYMKYLGEAICTSTKQIRGDLGLGIEREGVSYCLMATEFLSELTKRLEINSGDGCTTISLVFSPLIPKHHLI